MTLGLFRVVVALFCCAAFIPMPVIAQEAPMPATADSLVAVLPVVGSTPGAFGSYFKTAVQILNLNPFTINFRVVFHPSGRSGSSGDPSLPVSVPAYSVVYYADMLPAMGVATGIGSLDVFVPGIPPAATAVARVFNDAGAAGTSGFTESFVPVGKEIRPGGPGFLINAPDLSVYRFNVGVRSLSQGATMTVTVRNSAGAVTKTLTKTYAPDFFEQVSLDAFLGGAALSGNESLTIAVTAGGAVVYGTTVDNRTNDPSFQFAEN